MVQDPRIRTHSGTALPGTAPKYSQANVLGLELFEADSAGENGAQCEEHIVHRHDLPQREAIPNPFLPIGNAATTDSCNVPLELRYMARRRVYCTAAAFQSNKHQRALSQVRINEKVRPCVEVASATRHIVTQPTTSLWPTRASAHLRVAEGLHRQLEIPVTRGPQCVTAPVLSVLSTAAAIAL